MERTPCIAYVYTVYVLTVIVFASTFRWNTGYCAYCVYDAYKRHLLCPFVCIFSLSKCGRYLCDMFRILLYLYVLYHVDI